MKLAGFLLLYVILKWWIKTKSMRPVGVMAILNLQNILKQRPSAISDLKVSVGFRSTQPSILCWTVNEYQPKGGDAVRLGSKGRHGVICR